MGCSNFQQASGLQQSEPVNKIAINNVNIIPMTSNNQVIKNATVIIEDHKILSINSAASYNVILDDAMVIDGQGKWLIPGLIDMHVHNLASGNPGKNYPTKGASIFFDTQDIMLLYVANGVTTAFELSGRVEHFGQRNEIIKGDVIGPRIALAALIDGSDANRVATTPSEGRQAVRIAKGDGYEFIKVYSRLNIETYKAIIDEANKQGMKVVGHIPNAFEGKTEEAFVPHFSLVAHAEEFSKQTDEFTEKSAREFAEMTKKNGTWVIPNLSNLERIAAQGRSLDAVRNLPSFKYVHPLMQDKWLTSNQYNKGTSPKRVAYFDKLVGFHVKLVKAFKEAGVPMVAGTDAGTSGIVWGYSLHDELALLVDAGLTTEEALASATRLAATWLEIDDKIGTVEEGKLADLVLLDENPLLDINNTKKISGVFVNGRWVHKGDIDVMLDELARKNSENIGKDKFIWSKLGEQ
ncbi:amidohydrolase family protein [Kangiella shandongensis]|uniref:amidohydrolase family protein n=1 Tax=Kangiella shandongensis TaxID=2763258 RepID=UPI001CBED761|nr:amidohydrolase family protein [Kangiella shandongensis]